KHLANGVTTVRDLGGIGIIELAGAIEAGIVPGPRVMPAGSALTITGGHGHTIGIARQVDGADAIPRAVREAIRAGALTLKIAARRGLAGKEAKDAGDARAKAQAWVDEAKAGHARAIRGGVRHICSTDAGTPFNPHGNAPNEVIAMIDWGMKPLAAIVAATANGAEALRIPDVGRIAPGMRADLVLYDADPVEDPTSLREARAVWKDGA